MLDFHTSPPPPNVLTSEFKWNLVNVPEELDDKGKIQLVSYKRRDIFYQYETNLLYSKSTLSLRETISVNHRFRQRHRKLLKYSK